MACFPSFLGKEQARVHAKAKITLARSILKEGLHLKLVCSPLVDLDPCTYKRRNRLILLKLKSSTMRQPILSGVLSRNQLSLHPVSPLLFHYRSNANALQVNAGYHWNQEEPASILHTTDCVFNEYEGGVFQQAASGQAYTDSRAYELTEGLFSVASKRALCTINPRAYK